MTLSTTSSPLQLGEGQERGQIATQWDSMLWARQKLISKSYQVPSNQLEWVEKRVNFYPECFHLFVFLPRRGYMSVTSNG